MVNDSNPYQASTSNDERLVGTTSWVGGAFGVIGFLIGISPALCMCYISIGSLWTVATMEIPMTSIRPMGLAVAMMGLTVVGLALIPISLLFSWLAIRLGSSEGAMLAKSSVGLSVLPCALGDVTIILMMIICGIRGIHFGD